MADHVHSLKLIHSDDQHQHARRPGKDQDYPHSRESVHHTLQTVWIEYVLSTGLQDDAETAARPICEVAKGKTYFCFCSSTSSCLRFSASSSRSFFDRNFGCSSKHNLQDCTDLYMGL